MTLLTAPLAERVGETRTYTAPEPLSAASIRAYARAVGDTHPLGTPTLLCDSNQYLADARPDADGFAGHSWGIAPPGCRMVRGGNDYTFHRPARPDDVVTVAWRLEGLDERPGRDGRPMLVVTSRMTVTGQAGDPIVDNVETVVHVPEGPAGGGSRGRTAPAQDAPLARATRTVTLTDMVAYAGATWDFHRMHYDPAYVRGHALAGPVVDGQMLGAFLAVLARDAVGPRAWVRRLHFRFAAPVFAGETVRCGVWESARTDDTVTLRARVDVAGTHPRVAIGAAGAEVRTR